MTTFIGIDPGLTGAVALLAPAGAQVIDLPTCGNRIDGVSLYDWLLTSCKELDEHAFVELAQAMPGQGVTSCFQYGMGYGIVLGVLQALKIPYTEVRPGVWKKAYGLKAGDKEAARLRAQQLFPTCELRRKRDHGRAEALLIAHWGARLVG